MVNTKATTRRREAPLQTEGFGAKLHQIREMRGESVRQFAKVVKMSPSYVNKLELGHGQPTRATVEQITAACDYPPESLLHDAGYTVPYADAIRAIVGNDTTQAPRDTDADRLLYLWERLDAGERRAALALVEAVAKQHLQRPE